MPQWYFFAFNAKRVMNVLLNPVQNAIDNRDLSVWEKSYDLLSKSHYPPTEGGFAWDGSIIENLNRGGSLSRASVPERTSPVLRKCLQTFVELVSPFRLTSRCTRVRSQIVSVIPWEKVLSKQELGQMQLFTTEIIASERQPIDPFWCLASNDACDANYVAPEVVATAADAESTIGLFRNLVRRNDLDDDLKALAKDLAAVGLLIEMAANLGFALYFREDGT